MAGSLFKAFLQLSDPLFRRVLLLGLAGSAVVYALLYAAIGWGFSRLQLFGVGWADSLTDLLGGLAVGLLTLMLAPGVVVLVLSFLLEEIAQAVETRHYPGQPTPRRQGWAEVAWGALRFSAVTILANLVALPVYLALMVVGAGPLAFLLLNGYLLSREYFELVAARRVAPPQADALRRAHLGRLWLGGGFLALMGMVPLVNLLAPLVGTAAMVHEFENLRRKDGF
ncbi:MAG TPA: EI24 domain-containing protein [Candidatus Sulfotelmatobacter sp.]|jgi:uncharacterized protein involved in cysteine biosynthesis|nr:EI24 domain-containing protein [Candidatus Sulfotelmatobacter sp.]